jgi:hypothetical protein
MNKSLLTRLQDLVCVSPGELGRPARLFDGGGRREGEGKEGWRNGKRGEDEAKEGRGEVLRCGKEAFDVFCGDAAVGEERELGEVGEAVKGG